jgi:cell division protein FtsB
VEQNEELHKKIDQLIERQKIMEDKVTRLENEIHASQSLITEKDFVEVFSFRSISNVFKVI